MVNMKTVASLLLTAASLAPIATAVSAQNIPSYQAARAVYDAMDRTVGQTGGWSKKPLVDRLQAHDDAVKLAKKAELLFGTNLGAPSSSCWKAAIGMQFYISNMNDLALILEGKRTNVSPADLYAPMFTSLGFGEHKAACYQYVLSLNSRK